MRCGLIGIGLIKIYLISSIVPVFKNHKNVTYISLHPIVQLPESGGWGPEAWKRAGERLAGEGPTGTACKW